jgi:hypothetical protein
VPGSCDSGNEPLSFIKDSTLFDWLDPSELLKNDSVSWSYLQHAFIRSVT